MMGALKTMGFSFGHAEALWKIVAAVLHLVHCILIVAQCFEKGYSNAFMVLSISQRSVCSSHFDFGNRDRTIICIFINFGQHTYHAEIRNLAHFEDQKSMSSHWTNIEITIQVHQSWLTYFSCREDKSC